MDSNEIIAALAALAQTTRLEVFRRLVAAEPEGLAAGDLARALGVPQNTLSSHLAILARVGLVAADRRGRFVVYRAEVARLADLTRDLVADGCGGHPDLCDPPATTSCRSSLAQDTLS
jgi:DNA-binding transcriptional ArsR family regulator